MRALIAMFLLSSVAGLAAAEPNVAGEDLLGDAKTAAQSGRPDAAQAALNELDKRGTPSALALDLRGSIYLEQGKYDEAMKAFRAAQELDHAIYLPRLHVGDTALRQQKWTEARAAYELAMKSTNILVLSERLRYAILITYLGAKDDAGAKAALTRVVFPTETPAYYYAQAAWAFAHGDSKAGVKWMKTAEGIFDAKKSAWFARPLYDLGWIKTKPPLALD